MKEFNTDEIIADDTARIPASLTQDGACHDKFHQLCNNGEDDSNEIGK